MLPTDSQSASSSISTRALGLVRAASDGLTFQEQSERRFSWTPRITADGIAPIHDSPDGALSGKPLPLPETKKRSDSMSPFRIPMPFVSPSQLAFSAMQYLPVPLLVLNNLKTVVLANEAMGRLLGFEGGSGGDGIDGLSDVQEKLRGQTISQVGIDMLQDGRPVWITWETFLDSMVYDMKSGSGPRPGQSSLGPADAPSGLEVPDSPGGTCRASPVRPSLDNAVDVVISKKDIGKTVLDSRYKSRESEFQVYAKMIITIWEIEDQQTYFTLSFTSADSAPSTLPAPRKPVIKSTTLEAADRRSIASSTPTSIGSGPDSSSPFRISPSAVTLSANPFPPMGPPSRVSRSSAPSILQKISRMKDALVSTTQMPILAMWKDGSVTIPNEAARKLFRTDMALDRSADGFDLLHKWEVWTEDFSRKLDVSEFPISILLRTETPFSGMRIGMQDQTGSKIVLDVLGEAIRDETTGEFLAGVVTCRDVTKMAQEITKIREDDAERFQLICDTMPQLVWTATPEGLHDFYNTRWYHYTGLTPEESLGLGWKAPFHPDDMPDTLRRWSHSLKTGEPYVTEYRCRSRDGEWRWFLGRALPLRNKQTGEIEKWFGTCTDIHEPTEAKLAEKRTREQLLSVISHARVTIFTVDSHRRVTMLEGASLWDDTRDGADGNDDDSHWWIGKSMLSVFERLNSRVPGWNQPGFLQSVEDILDGKVSEDVKEHGIEDRWFRTRFFPIWGKKTAKGRPTDESCIEGAIGVIMDVTELKRREAQLEGESREKRQAKANEAAAKEANRLKSQFLANMSHEIRTPISGVLGMAEILSGMLMENEQQEYVENIQRSANALLTVINDILDFSKVESGHLDVEEVQFSLSVIVKDVCKMLGFAADRKDLRFESDIAGDIEEDMVVRGDPGRVRQIITNLLTNSIKFTNKGFVKFSVQKEKETANTIEVKFTIQDSGIGIEEKVRQRLFQPFSQGDASTARKFGGTGLGLTICKNLLDLMHGRITLESSIGQGTTATFWIPFNIARGHRAGSLVDIGSIPDRLQCDMSVSCNSSEPEPSTGTGLVSEIFQVLPDKGGSPRRHKSNATLLTNEQDLPRSERSRIHILIVEDNPINQKIATKFVTMLGFSVTAAWNGREALDYIRAAQEGTNTKPNIILMDVQMPVVDGYRCTHALRHHPPYKAYLKDVPIVAMTASAIQGDREKCTRAGMDDYLAKPVRSKTLESMLVRWSLSRRATATSSRDSEFSLSDCSEAGEHCSSADIPDVGPEEEEEVVAPRPFDEQQGVEDGAGPITPRPLMANGSLDDEQSPWQSPAVLRRRPTAQRDTELAMHLQSEKLLEAAGRSQQPGPAWSGTSGSVEALTEENVGKLDMEGGSLISR